MSRSAVLAAFIIGVWTVAGNCQPILNPNAKVRVEEGELRFQLSGTQEAKAVPLFFGIWERATSNRRPTITIELSEGATKAKVQIDESPDFASPILSMEGIPSGKYRPDFDLPQGRLYFRVSTDLDYAGFSETISRIIDTNEADKPTMVLEHPLNKANTQVELGGGNRWDTRDWV